MALTSGHSTLQVSNPFSMELTSSYSSFQNMIYSFQGSHSTSHVSTTYSMEFTSGHSKSQVSTDYSE